MDWQDHLHTYLLALHPERICALDSAALDLAHAALPNTPTILHEQSPAQTCTVALGVDALNTLDAQQSQHLINQTRLYVAPRMILVARDGCALDDATFRALGFTLSGTDIPNRIHLYLYDLDAYKSVPDWLNSRFWANPGRWEP